MTVVDVHCHLAPPSLAEMVGSLPGISLGSGSIAVQGATFPFPDALRDADACWRRFAAGTCVVSAPPSLFLDHLARADASRYAADLNDSLLGVIAGHERARYLAWLPLQSADAAMGEVRRVARDPRVVGVAIGTALGLADPALDILWRELASHELAIFLHPNADPIASATHLPRRGPTIGFPVATALAVSDLLLAGTGFWNAGVHLCLAHGGGALPTVVARVARAAGPAAERTVHERLTRVWVDAVVFGAPQRRFVIDLFGRDRVLAGTDWPYELSIADDELAWLGVGGQDAAARWAPRLALAA